MYLKNLDFKKYLGGSMKYVDKKKLNSNNYLPIWSCTSSCGEQKAHKYWKYLQVFNSNFEEKQRSLSIVYVWCWILTRWGKKKAVLF